MENSTPEHNWEYCGVKLTIHNVIIPEDRLDPTPSSLDGLDAEDETDLRLLGCEYIQDSGILLKLPQVAMATAQVLYQRFFYSKSLVKHFYEHYAMACVFLAAKIEECPKRLRDIINVFHHIRQTRDQQQFTPVLLDHSYMNLKNQVIKAERRVLKELGFCVHGKHPHKLVICYLQALELEKNTRLVQIAWNYMNDSLRTPVFVCYYPETIACACIFLAARQLGIPLPCQPPWWEIFDVVEESIHTICLQLLQIYARPKPNLSALESKLSDLKRVQSELREKNKEVGGNGPLAPVPSFGSSVNLNSLSTTMAPVAPGVLTTGDPNSSRRGSPLVDKQGEESAPGAGLEVGPGPPSSTTTPSTFPGPPQTVTPIANNSTLPPLSKENIAVKMLRHQKQRPTKRRSRSRSRTPKAYKQRGTAASGGGSRKSRSTSRGRVNRKTTVGVIPERKEKRAVSGANYRQHYRKQRLVDESDGELDGEHKRSQHHHKHRRPPSEEKQQQQDHARHRHGLHHHHHHHEPQQQTHNQAQKKGRRRSPSSGALSSSASPSRVESSASSQSLASSVSPVTHPVPQNRASSSSSTSSSDSGPSSSSPPTPAPPPPPIRPHYRTHSGTKGKHSRSRSPLNRRTFAPAPPSKKRDSRPNGITKAGSSNKSSSRRSRSRSRDKAKR